MHFAAPQPQAALFGISVVFFTAVWFVARWTKRWVEDPLRRIPGPRIASLTDLWRLRNALSGKEEVINLELHEEYGPLVRVGPTMVFVNDPEALSQIFRWNRSPSLQAMFETIGIQALIGDVDMKAHEQRKHAFKQPLSLPSILEHEAVIDKLVERWFQRLHYSHGEGETLDLSHWINLLPPDIASALLWSEPLGLVEKGEDFGNIVYGIEKFNSTTAIALIMPWIPGAFSALGFDPLTRRLLKSIKGISFMIELAQNVVAKAMEEDSAKTQQDVVQKLIEYRDRNGQGIPRERLNGEVYTLFLGASGTTASIIKMAVVYVATNPRILNRLVKDLDDADEKGLLSPVPQHRETSDLLYLTAIISETLRLESPQATPLPREVPKGGAKVCGYYLSEGTHVGISPRSFQARKDLYGEDVRSFRPERWLENEKQARLLQKWAATFGGGSTYCVGKNMADVEMNKILAQLFRRYTVIIQNPSRPIKRISCLSVGYSDLMVSLVPRKVNSNAVSKVQSCMELVAIIAPYSEGDPEIEKHVYGNIS